jgi:3-oxoacyl-[acyl-carrier protein] reductase
MNDRHAGRVAVVTGVSRRAGIGFAIAQRLLAEGASVLIHSWSAQRRGRRVALSPAVCPP